MTGLLIMDAPPVRGLREGPTFPTVIPACFKRPVRFADLAALARYIHRHREGRGLQLTPGVATYEGSDTFPVFRVSWLSDGDAEYAFTIAVQGRRREAVEAAIAAENPDRPAGLVEGSRL